MPDDKKASELRQQQVLNPHPHQVQDVLFTTGDHRTFFDARDLVQVKYEMLRRVQHDRTPVSQAAADFGFSRPSYYQIQAAFEKEGLPGLLPQKRGPRGSHKLSPEILEFVLKQRKDQPALDVPALVMLIQERFAVSLHRRTIERALSRKKNG